RLLDLTPEFQLVTLDSDKRREAENYIQARFRAAYCAYIHEFHDELLTMHCAGELSAIAGISKAVHQQLFLEQYTELPVEKELAQIKRYEVDRHSIVEIGNLVATTNGSSLAFFVVLASVLSGAGYKYMVFTATEKLRSQLSRLGFKTDYICQANPQRLHLSSDQWGSYYDSKPEVVTGSIEEAMHLIAGKRLPSCIQRILASRISLLGQQLQLNLSGV
ncbi:MAG: thermostable hemolysin, partial [Gammaproteobacteria bacterium]|nr:thermostable hemolysin [Gammaproteobacteria bacterium]